VVELPVLEIRSRVYVRICANVGIGSYRNRLSAQVQNSRQTSAQLCGTRSDRRGGLSQDPITPRPAVSRKRRRRAGPHAADPSRATELGTRRPISQCPPRGAHPAGGLRPHQFPGRPRGGAPGPSLSRSRSPFRCPERGRGCARQMALSHRVSPVRAPAPLPGSRGGSALSALPFLWPPAERGRTRRTEHDAEGIALRSVTAFAGM